MPNGIALLLICSFVLFVVPLISDPVELILTRLSYIVILLLASSLVEDSHKYYVYAALILVVSRGLLIILDHPLLAIYIDILTVMYLSVISIKLIAQIIKKEASSMVIIEAISGYILLGVALTSIMGVIVYFDSNAFSYLGAPLAFQQGNNFALYSYFVFITYTTVGYGDIVPLSAAARSLAKLTALAGQIYIAVVVAILIGKYLQAKD